MADLHCLKYEWTQVLYNVSVSFIFHQKLRLVHTVTTTTFFTNIFLCHCHHNVNTPIDHHATHFCHYHCRHEWVLTIHDGNGDDTKNWFILSLPSQCERTFIWKPGKPRPLLEDLNNFDKVWRSGHMDLYGEITFTMCQFVFKVSQIWIVSWSHLVAECYFKALLSN